ncbi:MAG TPA: hypothetical protein VHA76_07315, partial [Solirubrobacterales bacterium]|nr:hypothetical protein [Solirubrobacterales bacterium]
ATPVLRARGRQRSRAAAGDEARRSLSLRARSSLIDRELEEAVGADAIHQTRATLGALVSLREE